MLLLLLLILLLLLLLLLLLSLQVVQLLAERGLTDLDLVAGDPWSVHASPEQGRCIQLFMYARSR
jgi:hypothetical protein